MGEAEAARSDLIRCLKPSTATTSSRSAAVNPNNPAFFRPFGPSSFVSDTPVRPGIPPIPPSSSSSSVAFHSRSPSQPPAFFSLDSLPPPLSSPPPFSAAADTDRARAASSGLPPRKAHRRSQSDVAIGFFHPSPAPPFTPVATAGSVSVLLSQHRSQPSPKSVKQELEKETESGGEEIGDPKSEGGDTAEDLFNAYMNLDCLETLNASQEDLDSSRLSGSRTNMADSSENEAESSVVESSGSGVKNEGNNMSATGDPMPMTARHFRSLSMDGFMGKLHSGGESKKLLPSPGNHVAQLSRNGSMDGAANMVSSEFNGEFNSAEMKKIMANEKLVEMTLTDPKRVKRILANRQSAARSKERKMRYISELEHKVQTLQTEATTLSAQLTLLQRDSTGLTCQNNELRILLQAMEQQAQLRDAINEALTAEVQRLKLATGEITEAQIAKNIDQQMPMNTQIFQLHRLQSQQPNQQSSHMPRYQYQPPQQQKQQQNNVASEPEPQ